ncbi:hypothetical protein JWR93_16400 (plasmid) [Lactiplantibacillus plantarum]|nr:hypothetical protein JWR93_16400 [Lactiplantibacillus plantarum]
MEVAHTVDGYWVLYGSGTYEPAGNIQATMRQAKEQFIKANPLIDASKVVVVNGQFKQPTYKQPTLSELAKTDESKDLQHTMMEAILSEAKAKAMLGEL